MCNLLFYTLTLNVGWCYCSLPLATKATNRILTLKANAGVFVRSQSCRQQKLPENSFCFPEKCLRTSLWIQLSRLRAVFCAYNTAFCWPAKRRHAFFTQSLINFVKATYPVLRLHEMDSKCSVCSLQMYYIWG